MAIAHSQQIVQKLWSSCNLLRDDGLSYGDSVEQLTYLLFLKMAEPLRQAILRKAFTDRFAFAYESMEAQ